MNSTDTSEAILELARAVVGGLRLEQPSLRDYFAAHALAGMLGDHESASIMSSIDAAQAAYDYADAMLKVRAE